jgi:hypothetical protein
MVLLQNIKDSSYFRKGIFNNEERCCLFDRVSAEISKFKLKQVYYATKNTTMHSEASVEIRPKSQSLL